jgi:hypothetical protein
MGWSTEFVIAFKLKHDTPQQVIDTLKYMTLRNKDYDFPNHPDHNLFETYYWRIMLIGNYGSVPSSTSFTYVENVAGLGGMPLPFEAYFLNVRSVFLNYNTEIERFLHWIAPYSETQGFVGHILPKGLADPILIYLKQDKAFLVQINSSEREPVEDAINRHLEKLGQNRRSFDKSSKFEGKPWWWKPPEDQKEG